MAFRKSIRLSTSGSAAALQMVVRPARQDRRHEQVLGAGDARLGQAHVRAAQPAWRARVVVAPLVVDLGAECAQGVDVDVDRPPADAVAARVGDDDLAAPAEHRPEQHERRAQPFGRFERDEVPVELAGVDAQLVVADPVRLGAQVAQHFEDVLDVGDARGVGDRARLVAQDCRRHQLQDGVLGARDGQRAAQRDAAFDHVRVATRQTGRRLSSPPGSGSAILVGLYGWL